MSIEAMKQALEALKKLYGVLTIEEIAPVDQAITALRTALEQAAVAEPHKKQEPVAWMENESFVDADNLWDVRVTFNQNGNGIPLYTTPPAAQRQWVGLTDEERDEICLGDEGIAREIEAKLKEKNRGNHG